MNENSAHTPSKRSKPAVYYLAYGSNLNTWRMKMRCPTSKAVGMTVILDHRLVFRKSQTGFYASIDYEKGSSVPALVWRLSRADEQRLDGFEGYPRHYQKKYFNLKIQKTDGTQTQRRRKCMAYALPEERPLGTPNDSYLSLLDMGYRRNMFDMSILHSALEYSKKNS